VTETGLNILAKLSFSCQGRI